MLVVTIVADELWRWNSILHVSEGELTTLKERLIIDLMCCQNCIVTLTLCTVNSLYSTTCKEVSSRHIRWCIWVEVGQTTEINGHAIGTFHLNNALIILRYHTAICYDTRSTIIALWCCCTMIILASYLTLKGNRCLIVLINIVTYVTSVLILQRKCSIDFTPL